MKIELLPFCECGCGERVAKAGNRFINGHNIRVKNPMKNSVTAKKNGDAQRGKKCLKRSIAKTGDKNPAKRSEVREKMRAAREGKTWEEIFGFEKAVEMKAVLSNIQTGEGNRAKSLGARAKLAVAQTGEGNSNWKGGISKEPYPFEWTEELKESIRERDGRVCQTQNCGVTEEQNGRKLDVHHIDGDKKNCCPDNLISLCLSCHGRDRYISPCIN